MSSNTEIFNAVLRQQIFTQQFAGGEANTYIKVLDEVRRSTKSLLLQLDVVKLTKRQRQKLERAILKLANNIYAKANLRVIKTMEEFADYQAGFHKRVLGNATDTRIKTVSARALNKTVFETGINLGPGGTIELKQALTEFTLDVGKTITRTIRQGIIAGDTNREIRNSLNFAMKGNQTHRARALIRTITNHTGSMARTALYRANRDVIKEEKFVATLDVHTTLICAGLDGKRYEIGKGDIPPMHWQCRSIRIAVIKDEFDITSDVKTTRASRDSKTGKTVHIVDGRTTYNSWLKDQPVSVQETVLGPNRAKLFRDGDIHINKFTDDKFNTVTLQKLKKMESLAFEKAGI